MNGLWWRDKNDVEFFIPQPLFIMVSLARPAELQFAVVSIPPYEGLGISFGEDENSFSVELHLSRDMIEDKRFGGVASGVGILGCRTKGMKLRNHHKPPLEHGYRWRKGFCANVSLYFAIWTFSRDSPS
ncbi:hypothetical protein TanjilG_06506 [Lupinus angustifolius]|uniref:Uncharacterized protein n=1 Tax=Lupinus angustifolius TaxID=3871 RepID=A0A4P1REX9_LUPAN|nr:hypothetical protein TanjilG_06506 [Lupinus angustifolius]